MFSDFSDLFEKGSGLLRKDLPGISTKVWWNIVLYNTLWYSRERIKRS